MSSEETNGVETTKTVSSVPTWLEANLFEDLLKENVKDYEKIKNFKAYPAMTAGENYTTIMLRIEIEVELTDATNKTMTYMIKIAPDNPFYDEWMKKQNFFDSEREMYMDVVPEFERMYEAVGVKVKFGPRSYKLDVEENYVLLEDLRPDGFKNANRLEGLDMEHAKCALIKMAQWHAASATRIETKGLYEKHISRGPFREDTKHLMDPIYESMSKSFIQCVREYEGREAYIDNLEKFLPHLTDEMFKLIKNDPNDFNVLIHGDLWTNNIMYNYDNEDKIKETYFVDYQGPRYDTPVVDLMYFILSSTNFDLKLKQFDYFVKFYHDNLIENLQVLKYPKRMPTLKDIHINLFRYGLWGFQTTLIVLGAALLEPTKNANLDNFIGDSKEGADFKNVMYTNERYQKHVKAILPWLNNRGVFEI